MSPIRQERVTPMPTATGCLPRDSVVISGVSGTFPKSANIMELSDILYKKINPITSDNPRWKNFHPDMPEYLGQVPSLDCFDAQFFKVHYRLGKNMDCTGRKLLEHTYQAIYDAGLSPEHLSGKRTGVWVGVSRSESEKAFFYSSVFRNGFGIAGCSKSMFANRISYWLNLKGPSIAVDATCASSMVALEQAYESIKTGQCESAIVVGANVCLHPHTSLHFARIAPICPDGKTKSFDKNADGSVHSDSINVLFLQRAGDAKRIHARICHVGSHFGPQIRGSAQRYGPYRDVEKLTKFLRDFYNIAGIHPHNVEYVEAFGSGVPEADKSELEAIQNVFCYRRPSPLYVGSVMSNIGNSESASGTAAIIKVVLGYHTGKIAGNLHCDNPRDDVTALADGRMRIVTDHQTFLGTYTAVNNTAITGVNAHVLLQGFNKAKDLSRYHCEIPRLVLVSGRHEAAAKNILDDLKSRPIDAEEIGLFHCIHDHQISGHLGRGYTVLDTNEEGKTVSLVEKVDYCDDARKPLWFVYSGMGSQWAGMGAQLMRIPVFAAAIERCDKVLKTKGVDIVHIITSPEKEIFDNILNSFVGIAAIQIGLTDVLRELNIFPDKIIGHSVGELGCAYADGCFTAEEMILSAYSRGLVSVQTPFIRGSMAAIGLGYNKIVNMLPPEIEVACHNSSESSTISGPADVMKEFVAELTEKGIFAKEVPCSNIAYHSRYIKEAGPGLLKYLSEVIKSPKKRSDRWVSTSVPKDKWENTSAQYSSAEYHTNNLLNPVLFEETSVLVPANAVLIEVAPHGLLQAILKRSLPASCVHVPLTRRGHADNALFALQAVGKLYLQGFNPQIQYLYPEIEYPVSTGTPFLSHLVKWAHDEQWGIPMFVSGNTQTAIASKNIITTHDVEHKYLKGNVHGDETLYPLSGALVSVWDTLAMSAGAMRREMSVQFANIHIHMQPRLYEDKVLRFNVQIQKGNGYFEVMVDTEKFVTGYVLGEIKQSDVVFSLPSLPETNETILSSSDVYKMFNERGSYYQGEFRNIKSINEEMTRARIAWTDNWITLFEAMIQMNILRRNHKGISHPRFIRQINIDLGEHLKDKDVLVTRNNCFEAIVFEMHDAIRCGGIIMKDMKFKDFPPICSLKSFQLKHIEGPTGHNLITSKRNISKSTTATLRSTKVGDLNSLQWEEQSIPESDFIGVTVHFAGLNYRDAIRATGATLNVSENGENPGYGMDFSGINNRGERVMGIVPGGAASSLVAAEPALLWPVPEHWSLEDAATVPLPYAHAFYCLGIKTELLPGMSVLVHSATGALGQAAISIALAHGCRVFATVSTMKKKHFLRKIFPTLPDDHIGNSRDSTFVDMVTYKNKGQGCDVTLSGLKGELLNLTLENSKSGGIVLDVSQLSAYPDYEFGLSYLTRDRNYVCVDFCSLFKERKEDMKKLQLLVSEGISRGYVRPLTRVVYDPENTSRAFNLLANSQHRGRVLLQIAKNIPKTMPRISLNPDQSHLVISYVTEDLLVASVIDTLIARDAKIIDLHLQQNTGNPSDGYMKMKIKQWRKCGVKIEIVKDMLHRGGSIEYLLNYCNGLGPLEGLYVLANGDMDEKTQSELKSTVIKLDLITRKCSSLKYFIVMNENEIGLDVSKKRIRDKVPIMMLCLPKLNEVDQDTITANKQDALYSSVAVEALELALQTSGGVFTVNSKNQEEKTERKVSGLGMLFNVVDPDELFGVSDIIFMPTITNHIQVQSDHIDDDSYLVLVPGLEGHYGKFKSLCERLKMTAVVLQLGTDNPHETVPEIAARLAEIVLKKLKPKPRFQLLGYSFGVIIALEIAAILEQHGLEGVVYCVDGSPETFGGALEAWLSAAGATDEERLQDALVQHMYALMTGPESSASALALSGLRAAHSWRDKVEVCVAALRGRVSHSAQYTRALIETAHARIETARRYDAERLRTRPLRSQLVVMRCSAVGGDDLGLSRYSVRAPVCYTLQADHATALEDLRVANIVNRHLHHHITETFLKRNLCETYLLNSMMFEYNI